MTSIQCEAYSVCIPYFQLSVTTLLSISKAEWHMGQCHLHFPLLELVWGANLPSSSLSQAYGRAGIVIIFTLTSLSLGWCVDDIGRIICLFNQGAGRLGHGHIQLSEIFLYCRLWHGSDMEQLPLLGYHYWHSSNSYYSSSYMWAEYNLTCTIQYD